MPALVLHVLAQAHASGGDLSIVSLIFQASPLVKLVLLFLTGLSIASWGVIFLKSQTFRRASQESSEILYEMEKAGSLADLRDMVEPYEDAPEATLIKAGFDTWARGGGPAASPGHLQRVRHAMERASKTEILRLERYMTLLATTGSASPFIGLFGTVYGIMNTFRALGLTGSTSLSVVAPGIAEALIATAVGLWAAIPAVMAYNHYVHRVRVVASSLDSFSTQFLDQLQESEG